MGGGCSTSSCCPTWLVEFAEAWREQQRRRKSGAGGFLNRRPKVSIRIGSNIQDADENADHAKVVFIFGGPGSKKGRIITDLCNMYGFELVSAERLILQHLPNRVAEVNTPAMTVSTSIGGSGTSKFGFGMNPALQQQLANIGGALSPMDRIQRSTSPPTPRTVQEVLDINPHLLSLAWVLEVVEGEVRNGQQERGQQNFLVDIMPNLRFFLTDQHLVKEDVSAEMTDFEETHPVMFGLNLAIPEDTLLQRLEEKKHHKHRRKDNRVSTGDEDGGQSDEADLSRTQHRLAVYESSVRAYMSYFKSQGRLVTVDVSCGVPDLIWHKVNEFFVQLNFKHHRTINTVIVFSFSSAEFDGLDYNRYRMEEVTLHNIADNPHAPANELLDRLGDYIDKHSSPNVENFAVDCSNTSLDLGRPNELAENLRRHIMFIEHHDDTITHGYLDNYIAVRGVGKPERARKSSLYTKEYRVFSSTEKEVCMFSKSADVNLCKQIASYMAGR